MIFIGGFIAGVSATLFLAYGLSIIDKPSDEGQYGLELFDEKGECIETDEVKVFQVLESNMALATTINYVTHGVRDYSNTITVLLINYDGKAFYDDQKLKIQKEKCLRQIGVYQYTTKADNFEKTVPAVSIE